MFAETESGFDRHQESPFDDFELQPLLPNKLSQLGPGVALADVDGDGDDDALFSAGNLQKPMLYLNDGNGNFHSRKLSYGEDSNHEDLAPLFFDCDGDRDVDLYIVSGGVEFGGNERSAPRSALHQRRKRKL